MTERGVPIDGVGFQSHFTVGEPNIELLSRGLKTLSDMGLIVEITEVDIPLFYWADDPEPLERQGEAYAAVVQACLDVENCTGVTTWNTHDGVTWLDLFEPFSTNAPNRPLLLDENLEPKPAYFAVRDVLLNELAR